MYLAGCATIIGIWLAGTFIYLIAALLVVGDDFDPEAVTFGPSWSTNFVSLVTFVPFFFATPLVVMFFHGRPWRTIITPFRKIRIRMIALGAGIWAGLMTISILVTLPLTDVRPTWAFEPATFAANLVVVIVVLFFQTTAEELFFRGYLGSWLSLRLKNVWVQSAIIGFLFMLPHMANPEVIELSGLTYVLACSTYFAVGFAWMFVSHTTGSIEIAVGAHFINNFIVMMILGPADSSLAGASMWVTDAPFSAWDALGTWAMVALFVLFTFRIRGTGVVVPVQPPKIRPQPQRPVAPPSWQPDPWRIAHLRYWDGYRWSPWTYNYPPTWPSHAPTSSYPPISSYREGQQ